MLDVKEAVLAQTLLPDGEQIQRNVLSYMVVVGLDDGDEDKDQLQTSGMHEWQNKVSFEICGSVCVCVCIYIYNNNNLKGKIEVYLMGNKVPNTT